MRPIITSEKHIVQLNRATVAGLSIDKLNVVKVIAQDAVATAPVDVRIGTEVKAVYVQLWISGQNNVQSAATIIFEKFVNNAANPTVTDMALLNEYANKKNILKTFQGIVGDTGSTNPVPVINEWIKIPKGKQRFGLGDGCRIIIQAKDTDIEFCGLSIFKAYT